MPSLTTIGLEATRDFPTAAYEAVHGHLSSRGLSTAAPWQHYAGGWNALAYRFLTCTEHDDAFTASVARSGSAPVPPERHIQERELFAFFITGLSALEGFHFAAHAIGAFVAPAVFPMATPSELRAVTVGTVVKRFASAFTGDNLTTAMAGLQQDPLLTAWQEIRNVLAHRVAPGRTHNASVGGVSGGLQDTVWLNGIPIDATTTASRRKWLAGAIVAVVEATKDFVRAHIP